jgi:hypothetical protein
MLRTISAFVETPFYVVAVALVIFVAVFWFALKHERSLLLPFTRGACCCHSSLQPRSLQQCWNDGASLVVFHPSRCDKTTSDLATLAQSGRPLFGIQESNGGKVVIFGGEVPVVLDGTIVAAVGASAGTVEQDIAVAEAAITALGHQA